MNGDSQPDKKIEPAETATSTPQRTEWRGRWGLRAAAGALAAVAIIVVILLGARYYLWYPIHIWLGPHIHAAPEWIRGLGPAGPACFAAAFVATTVLLISSSLMIALGGYLFGMTWGFLPMLIGFTLGAAVSFALGRTLLRGWAQRKLSGHPLLGAIDKVVEERGFRIVLLTRLTPAPSVLMNYGFGLTKVRFWPYVLGTALGMVPRTLTYLYVGSTMHSVAEIIRGHHRGGPIFWIQLAVGAVVTVIVVLIVGRTARRMLNETLSGGENVVVDMSGTDK